MYHLPFKKLLSIPHLGQRILRSMLAAWACMAVYYLRGRRGLPFFSVIAALQCIQPYAENMLILGKRRVIGTVVGAVWGAAVLYLEFLTTGYEGVSEGLHFALLGACVGAVIYSTVVLKISDSAYFSAVVFLSIAMNHAIGTGLRIYLFDRVLDTFIGVIVGIFVNSLHLPRVRNKNILFISGIDPIVSGEKHQMSPYTKVELNRLIRDGALVTVITKETPAMVTESVSGIKLPYPVIAMDGAVMVDIDSRTYLHAEKMDDELGTQMEAFFRCSGTGYFVNTIEDNLLVAYYHEMKDGAMKRLYQKKSGSLYRNFVHTDQDVCTNILNFVTVGTQEEMQAFRTALMAQPFADKIRTDFDTFGCDEGEVILRIYAAGATRDRMIHRLMEQLGADHLIKFGLPEPCADEVLPRTGDKMVKEIKKRFETVSLRGWKNMIRWS